MPEPTIEKVFAETFELTDEIFEANPFFESRGYEQGTILIVMSTDPTRPSPCP